MLVAHSIPRGPEGLQGIEKEVSSYSECRHWLFPWTCQGLIMYPRKRVRAPGVRRRVGWGGVGRGDGGDLTQGTEDHQRSQTLETRSCSCRGPRAKNSEERHPKQGGAAPRWLQDPDVCSPVSASWSALLKTLSLCSLTQPRVLRRLERKPTAAAISGSMSVLFP